MNRTGFSVVVSPLKLHEQGKFVSLMGAHHYLGWRGVVGERILYVAKRGEQWLALLAWTSAAQKVGVRDRFIGWDDAVREDRLRFVANNARFLMLPEVAEKNLASRILSLSLRRLSGDWERFYGHPILMAETFVDPARFAGTCYRAANWTPLGETRGFGKKNGQWVEHGMPKRVFVYPLWRRACERLSNPERHPLTQTKEVYRMAINRLPIQGKGSLIDVLMVIPDPRSRLGRQHPLVGILAISLCAVLSGARGFQGIADWAASLTESQLRKFCIRKKRPPSESTFRKTLQAVDAEAVDRRFSAWFHHNQAFKDQAISVDGKALRGARNKATGRPLMLLSAVLHQEQTIIAQVPVDEKSNEIPAIKVLFNPLDISGAVVTADALHTQDETARYLVKDKHADFVLTVKDNQPKLLETLTRLDYLAFSPEAPRERYSNNE